MINFTFLSENKTEHSRCLAEHGLSIYIEADDKTILFDTGGSDVFYKNAKALNIDLEKVQALVISHGHYDHTDGIPWFCKYNQKAPIYIHKNGFYNTFAVDKGVITNEAVGIRFDYSKYLDRIIKTDGPVFLSPKIVISGRINSYPDEKHTERFWRKNQDGSTELDDMSHEQFLAISTDQGIVLFSGCSHRGVVGAIRHCKEIFPGEKIGLLVAGLHLYGSDKDTVNREIEALLKEGVDTVMPVHCTGINAITQIKSQLGDKCILGKAGDSYTYG